MYMSTKSFVWFMLLAVSCLIVLIVVLRHGGYDVAKPYGTGYKYVSGGESQDTYEIDGGVDVEVAQ